MGRLRAHPENANVMVEERLLKLEENIRQEGDYPPLVVRPHPKEPGSYQILDGHQRFEVLKRLGHEAARGYVWPCSDTEARVLLLTLNRLEGRDDPLKRAQLLQELTQLVSPQELARLLPEDAASINWSLELLDLDLEGLLADLEQGAGPASRLRAMTFAVSPEDESAIEEAVRLAAEEMEGLNKKGRALAHIAREYLEGAR